jgi:hypothetical protein
VARPQKQLKDRCAQCRKAAPQTPSSYSLIAQGWRLIHKTALDGRESMEWRCPECVKSTKKPVA